MPHASIWSVKYASFEMVNCRYIKQSSCSWRLTSADSVQCRLSSVQIQFSADPVQRRYSSVQNQFLHNLGYHELKLLEFLENTNVFKLIFPEDDNLSKQVDNSFFNGWILLTSLWNSESPSVANEANQTLQIGLFLAPVNSIRSGVTHHRPPVANNCCGRVLPWRHCWDRTDSSATDWWDLHTQIF